MQENLSRHESRDTDPQGQIDETGIVGSTQFPSLSLETALDLPPSPLHHSIDHFVCPNGENQVARC
jgi:hypothetical protein